MPGLEQITPVLYSGFETALFWIVYGILLALVCGAVYFYYYSTQYKIKMYYWQVFGNAKDGYTVDKPKKLKLKFNKDRTAWNIFLKRKKTIEPFNPSNIYPGNIVYAFKFGESFVPAKVNISEEIGKIQPVPYHVKNLHFLELKENEVEFQKKDFWTQNKTLFIALIVSALCLGLTAVTVYYCLKTASGTAADIKLAANAWKGLTKMTGAPV